jgi:uncharacterized surface protein with fasciclin (FAS1) repeats
VILLLVGLWFAGIILPACNKSNNSGSSSIDTATSTITTILKSSANATFFYYAMTRTGLDSMLNSTDMFSIFTVFVPTDSAFEVSGITKSILHVMTDSALRRLVSYLMIQKGLLSYNVRNADQNYLTVDGETVFLTDNRNGFYINGIPVSQGDIKVKNGVIQFIWEAAPLPPAGDHLYLIHSDTTFTYLAAALNRANTVTVGMGFPNFNYYFTGASGVLTLFAPTNQAFRANGYPDTSSINAANPDSLFSLITYHVLPIRLFTSDITNGQRFPTQQGDSIQFSFSGASIQVIGNHNAVPANILKANTMANSGVLFTIDQLLKP